MSLRECGPLETSRCWSRIFQEVITVGLHRCASCWTRPLGGGRSVHYFRNLWRGCLAAHKTACKYFGICGEFMMWEPYMLASARQASLNGFDACEVSWDKGALRRNCRREHGKTSPFFFLFSRNTKLRFFFLGHIFWHLWIGRAQHPRSAPSSQVGIEVFNVGGWLIRGDLALEAKVDFLAVVDRLIPVADCDKCICTKALVVGGSSRSWSKYQHRFHIFVFIRSTNKPPLILLNANVQCAASCKSEFCSPPSKIPCMWRSYDKSRLFTSHDHLQTEKSMFLRF